MFDDVGKTVKAILYDRITSPLFGTFIFSWCGWNWRLMVLFLADSSTTVAKKFQYVDLELYPSNSITFTYGLLLPATTTAFFIYIYPWFAKKVYGYWREQQNELKKLQVEKDGEKPLTKEEAQEITNQALLSELRYQEEREKREARIKDLEKLVKSLQAVNSSVPENNADTHLSQTLAVPKLPAKQTPRKVFTPDVENGMFALLDLLAKVAPDDYIQKQQFMNLVSSDESLSKLTKTLVLHCLDNLLSGSYINESSNSFGIRPRGRAALINGSLDVEF